MPRSPGSAVTPDTLPFLPTRKPLDQELMKPVRHCLPRLAGTLFIAGLLGATGCRSPGPKPGATTPKVTLRSATVMHFPGANRASPDEPGECDCNSPLHWDGDTLYVFNSVAHPWRASGPDLARLGETSQRAEYNNVVEGGRWIESTWRTKDGTLYGWYHFEPTGLCPETTLTAPRIGMLRSRDNGARWEDLGVILEPRPNTLNCASRNFYFAGGNGDFTVMLDHQQEWLYFLFSTYAGEPAEQGVAIARLRWFERDDPVGRVRKWHAGTWNEPGRGGKVTPIFAVHTDWHHEDADALWGPSIHWNTHLRQYVMLLNRASDYRWRQEGVYVSFNPDLSNPAGWTPPEKILGDLKADGWYPQVVGLNAKSRETDKLAGRTARLFVRGESHWEIEFEP